MTEYLKSGPFSVQMAGDKTYRDHWDAIFAKPVDDKSFLVENYEDGDDLGNLEGRTVQAEALTLAPLDEAKLEAYISKGEKSLYEVAPLHDIPGSIQYDVRQFHRVMGQPILDTPTVPSDERVRHRLRLIHEEYAELLAACGVFRPANLQAIRMSIDNDDLNVDLVEVADALADIAYVVEGFNLEAGLNSEAVLAEVQRSNLSKLDNDGKPVVNDLGKVTKGPNYSPPNIRGVLKL